MRLEQDPEDTIEKGEDGDWQYKVVVDATGRSALSAAEQDAPPEALMSLLQQEAAKLSRGCNIYHTTSLAEAARTGKLAVVRRLLDAGAEIHTPQIVHMGASPMEEAARKGHLDILKILLDAEREETAGSAYSLEARELAVQNAQHEVVERLVRAAKFLKSATEDKSAALRYPASSGDLKMATLLCENGADPNAYPSIKDTPLGAAAKGGHIEMVRYLLSQGADVDKPGYTRMTPLRAASQGGYLDIVEVLLEAGAKVNFSRALQAAAAGGHLVIVERLLEAGELRDHEKVQTWDQDLTSLQEAARGGHLDVVETLLKTGADVNAPATRQGRTALQAAAGAGSVELVKRLIDAGAQVNAPAGEWGRTALQAASEIGDLQIVNILLDSGVTPNTEASAYDSHFPSLMLAIQNGHTPVVGRLMAEINGQDGAIYRNRALHAATKMGYEDVVKLLLELKTPTTVWQNCEMVPLASGQGHTSIVKLLLDAGANMDNNPEHFGGTALQAAVSTGHIETARLLLDYGADVNVSRSRQKPPLHIAAKKKDIEMVKMLLAAGADIHAVSYTGKTVQQVAEKYGSEEIIQIVKRKEAERPKPPASYKTLDVSKIERKGLCSTCASFDIRFCGTPAENWLNVRDGYVWHPSLTSLQDSARSGCPFCMFFWRQLGIQTITIPQPSKVQLYRNNRGDDIWSQIDEPFPQDIEAPLQLHADFHICVEPFEGKRKALPYDTASASTFEQARTWLSECIRDHPRCRENLDETFLPTRLLDLSLWSKDRTLRLVETQSLPSTHLPYLTLSHRWNAGVTTSSSTTLANVESRMEKITADDLPLTFTHAVQVAHELRIEYIWIDSLCIIQDSKVDWEHETGMMSKIYRNTHCTIFASASESDSEGLFRSEASHNDSVEFPCTSETGETKLVRAVKKQQWWANMYRSGPLQDRGWVMQERELSPRILHYTPSQVLWECRTFKASEGWPTKDEPNSLAKEDKRLLDSIDDLDEHGIYDKWYYTVSDYRTRQLTEEDDTLPALGGLARIVGGYTKAGYVAGLWARDLLRSLAWESHHPYRPGRTRIPHSRHTKYIAPTWSWASVNGAAYFDAITATFEEISTRLPSKGMATITQHTIDLASPDPFGRLKSASLNITAPIINAVLGYDGSSDQYSQRVQIRDFSGEKIMGDVHFDVPAERGGLKVVRCIFLFVQKCRQFCHGKDGKDLCGAGLAIVPVEGEEGVFKRVGLVRCLRLAFFEGVGEEEFVLV